MNRKAAQYMSLNELVECPECYHLIVAGTRCPACGWSEPEDNEENNLVSAIRAMIAEEDYKDDYCPEIVYC